MVLRVSAAGIVGTETLTDSVEVGDGSDPIPPGGMLEMLKSLRTSESDNDEDVEEERGEDGIEVEVVDNGDEL